MGRTVRDGLIVHYILCSETYFLIKYMMRFSSFSVNSNIRVTTFGDEVAFTSLVSILTKEWYKTFLKWEWGGGKAVAKTRLSTLKCFGPRWDPPPKGTQALGNKPSPAETSESLKGRSPEALGVSATRHKCWAFSARVSGCLNMQ